MLDISTAQDMTYLAAWVDGLIAILLWQAQKRLIGSVYVVAACLVTAVAGAMIMYRAPASIMLGAALIWAPNVAEGGACVGVHLPVAAT